MVSEAAKQVHIALNSNQTKNMRDGFRQRFDQIFFLMKKIRGPQM